VHFYTKLPATLTQEKEAEAGVLPAHLENAGDTSATRRFADSLST